MGICGSVEKDPPHWALEDNEEKWDALYAIIRKKLEAGDPISQFNLVLWADLVLYLGEEKKQVEEAAALLEKALVNFHLGIVKEQEDRKNLEAKRAEEEKKGKQRKSAMVALEKPTDQQRSTKLAVRFLQRQLVTWQSVIKSETVSATLQAALQRRAYFAKADGVASTVESDSDSDMDEEQTRQKAASKTDNMFKWIPQEKPTLQEDLLDLFLLGNLDHFKFRHADVLALFFKLRYGTLTVAKIPVAAEPEGTKKKKGHQTEGEADKGHTDARELLVKPMADAEKAISSTDEEETVDGQSKEDLQRVVVMCKVKLEKWAVGRK
eukprot:gb/GEZN01008651.1/.p1 GENE.gb/GEZN01008651.1/~~gb/GEZN01008651.1/.p1  ORF type:complete len:323 (+),score=73.87 gb/GEZN01008651.1/:118-1086(+)